MISILARQVRCPETFNVGQFVGENEIFTCQHLNLPSGKMIYGDKLNADWY